MLRDGRGDARKEKFWRRMVGGQARSGRTIRDWCRKHGLNEPAFYWWRARLARTERMRRPRKSRPFAARPTPLCSPLRDAPWAGMGQQGQAFVPIRVSAEEAPGADGSIEIVLREDRRIRVRGPVDRQALADVLAVLALDAAGHPGLEASPC